MDLHADKAGGPAVIDMDDFAEQVTDVDVIDEPENVGPDTNAVPEWQSTLSSSVADHVWNAGKQSAQQAISTYGRIDVLRPYFDVEPKVVVDRLMMSFVPKKGAVVLSNELYGPVMVMFTLIAVLLFSMKLEDHQVQEGTLIGTAFGVCFGYWCLLSALLLFLSYLCNSQVTTFQIFHLIGYSLTAHCLVIFITSCFHFKGSSHVLLFLLLVVLGGSSCLRLASTLATVTPGPVNQKIVVAAISACANIMFVIYLHFAYHNTVFELDGLPPIESH